MRLLSRSATNRRPCESSASACGTRNCPRAEPVPPHCVTNLPSRVNLRMRLLDAGSWPSLTNTSPFAATATSVGPSKCALSLPATPASPSVSSTRPSALNFDDLMAAAVARARVRHPYVAFAVDIDAVRPCETSRAEASDDFARRVRVENRREVRGRRAVVRGAALRDPERAVRGGVDAAYGAERAAGGRAQPGVDRAVGVRLGREAAGGSARGAGDESEARNVGHRDRVCGTVCARASRLEAILPLPKTRSSRCADRAKPTLVQNTAREFRA